MQIFAFRGTRYHPSSGDPGNFAAPPFDQIEDPLAICELLLPESTRFLPKLPSGLVWARHETPIR